jgi:hypothetical protein
MNHVGKTFLSIIAITLAILCKLAPAQAEFNALQDQGGVLVTDPSCSLGNALSNGAICGVVGTDGHLWVNRFDGSGFTDLGGQVIGKPSCTHFNNGVAQAFCGVRGTDSAVYVNFSSPFETNPSWSGFQRIGGVSISDPVCTGLFNPNGGQAICAIIRPNGALAVSMTSDGSNWTAFADLLGGAQFNPTCTSFFNGGAMPQSGGALCGAVTTAGDFRVEFFNGATWDQAPTVITFPPNSSVSIASDPSCTFVGSGRQVICGIRGSDSALYVSQFDGTTFSQFQSLGGVLFGAPSCTSENFGGTPAAVCAVRGMSSPRLYRLLEFFQFFELYVNQFNNGTWSGFQPIPGAVISGDPSCTIVPNNPPTLSAAVWCGVKSTDSSLWVTVGP